MFKFIYAKHKIHPKIDRYHQQWYCLIDNYDSLKEFLELRTKSLVGSYFYIKKVRASGKTCHFSNPQHVMLETRFLVENIKETKNKSLADDCKILDEFTTAYVKFFINYGSFVVSPNWAFRDIDNTFEILDKIESKFFIFPEDKKKLTSKDISVTKWPEGKHWYAKVGSHCVINDIGESKWNSYNQAQIEAEKFLDKINMEVND
jgi:hypothetical protein